VRIENFRVTFDASRVASFQNHEAPNLRHAGDIGACSIAFAREPLPMKWTIDGAEREATVFPLSTSTATKAP